MNFRGASCVVDSRFLDQIDIRLRASVADGRLVRVHFDNGIVHVHRGKGREHVLDRMDADRAFSDRGRTLDRLEILDLRVHRRFVLQIDPPELDPVIGRRRVQF